MATTRTQITRRGWAAATAVPSRRLGLTVAFALLPPAALAAMLFVFVNFGDLLLAPPAVPADALGRLDVERLAFRPDGIVASVVNSGPAPLTVAQVAVNGALWSFAVEPDATIPRLGRATVTIPFPWLEGEPHKVSLVTANGLEFEKEVAVAIATPEPAAASFATFALLGLYAGVVPIYLGLLWWPVLRRLRQRWMGFLLGLTAGVLVFLAVDLLSEAREIGVRLPRPYQGTALLTIGLVVGAGALVVSRRVVGPGSHRDAAAARLSLAYLIAVGIGLHNFGEGLAIGAAYALGQVALGALLVVGFTVHNTTEGIAIVGPISRDRGRLWHLVALGAIAGAPTVVGSAVGGLVYADPLAALFLAVGAGAVLGVLYELAKLVLPRPRAATSTGSDGLASFVGLVAGLLLMYVTGLFVAV